jgi:hypothetical protein
MKILFAAGALFAVTIGIEGMTFAQAQQAPVYRFCLLERGPRSGEMMTCRYNTWEQCMASRGGGSDTCMVNPQLTFPPR